MRLIMVRHGESLHNRDKIIQGQQHSRLSDAGIVQAKKLSKRLKKEKIDVVFCSDLRRAKQTAKEILKYHNTPVFYSSQLRERSFGVIEGKPRRIYEEITSKKDFKKHLYKPKKGENFVDVHKRADKFLKGIYKKYKGRNVLIVSHGGFIKMLICILLNKTIEKAVDIKQKNTCVNIICVNEDGKHKAKLLNCIKHL